MEMQALNLIVRKAQTHRTKRILEKREPQVHENTKSAMIMRGPKTSEMINLALRDLYLLKKANGVHMKQKNDIRPFEDESPLSFLSKKNDSSLFVLGSHMKKRPNHLIFGRMFNFQLLDMVEFELTDFKSMDEFQSTKFAVGTKPAIMFNGEGFEVSEDLAKIKNMFLDFFRGPEVEAVDLGGFELVISISCVKNMIHLRCYKPVLYKSGTKLPRIELEEIGPFMDLQVKRVKFASSSLMKEARRIPKEDKPKKIKNISTDELGHKVGRVHLGKQDFGKLQTRKMKGLKRKFDEVTSDAEK